MNLKASSLQFRHILMVLAAVIPFFSSCTKQECEATRTYLKYETKQIDIQEARSGFATMAPREIQTPGKILTYGNYLLISDNKQGIHVVNNSDPANPVKVSFINIPGNVDLNISQNILYADSYMDLLAIDISNPEQVMLAHREEDAIESVDVNYDEGYIIDRTSYPITKKLRGDCNDPFFDNSISDEDVFANRDASLTVQSLGNNVAPPSVKAGSMSRFAINSNYLYLIDGENLNLYNIASPALPSGNGSVNIGRGIETLFAQDNKLFVGASDGMYIYSLSNPQSPQKMSKFEHVETCDPVVAEGDYAYVTLRSGTTCGNRGGWINRLDVVDISNPNSPRMRSSTNMNNPHGLSLSGQILFVCDGKSGIKAYNVENPAAPRYLGFQNAIHAIDVIANENNIIVTGFDGIYQFTFDNGNQFTQLSAMPVTGR